MVEKQTGQRDSQGTTQLCILWAAVLCAGLLLYGLTSQQGVSWQDSGMLQWRILNADYAGRLGLALAHPLYIAIGRLFLWLPGASDFMLLNWCSGAGMALTLANVFVLGFLLTGKRWIGLLTAGLLSMMHTPWWLATITEVYTWNTAFFTAELILLISCIRQPDLLKLAGLFFCNGLNLSVHNMALLNLPVYGIWILVFVCRRRLPPVAVVCAGLAYVCGAAPLLWLLVQDFLQTGGLLSSLRSMLVGRYAPNVLNVSLNQPLMRVNAALSSLNFLHFGSILGGWGLIAMVKRAGKPLSWSVLALLGLQGLFFVRFSVPDQFTFILPTLVLFSLGIAVGMDEVAQRSSAWRKAVVVAGMLSIVLMPLVYAVLPPVLTALNLNVKRARVLPFRDEMRYWLVPWKNNERSAEQFASAALSEAAPNGLLACDSTSYYPLILMQDRMSGVEGVAIEQYATMVKRIGASPDALGEILQKQQIFAVAPVAGLLAEEQQQFFEFTRDEGLVLYAVSRKRIDSLQ